MRQYGTPSKIVAADLEVDGTTVVVDEVNNRLGVNTATPAATIGVDGDLHFQPTAISTSHITTAGSLDIRCDDNMKIGTDGADSVRIGRTNTTAAKVHIRSGSDADLVVTNGKVGIGMEDPSEALEVDGDIQLSPTAISTAHIKTAGSLDVRCSGNLKLATDGADSVRIGRVNSTAVKVHLRSGADDDLVIHNSMVGIGTDAPSTTLDVDGAATIGGVLDITDTTDASDATGDTGALRCEGGASIAKKLYVGTDADIDGTLEADAITVDGTALAEVIQDTVGAMVSSNTETGISVTYEDSDGTLDFALAAVSTAAIADDAVTVAKIEDLARGQIIYGDASAETAKLSPGANGTVLTSDGTDISWQASSGGGTAADDANLILHMQVFA